MTQNFNTAPAADNQTKDEWLTPPEIIRALGEFDLDPCAPKNRPWPTAKAHMTIDDNGLAQPWHGRVWMNPPYGKETFKWMERLAEHKSGIALIFARTETKGFHRFIWERAHALFFFEGRINFYHVTGVKGDAANAPSVLVSFSPEDTAAIKASGLVGKLVYLGVQ